MSPGLTKAGCEIPAPRSQIGWPGQACAIAPGTVACATTAPAVPSVVRRFITFIGPPCAPLSVCFEPGSANDWPPVVAVRADDGGQFGRAKTGRFEAQRSQSFVQVRLMDCVDGGGCEAIDGLLRRPGRRKQRVPG